MVISCNLVADGTLWISPIAHAGKTRAQCSISFEWVANHHWTKSSDKGKMAHYLSKGLVIPIWRPQRSLVVTGGSFQENMVH